MQELRLVHCQTTPAVIQLLINYLLENDIPLLSLGLIDMKIPPESIEHLAQYINKNNFLKKLDISWNELNSKSYIPLIQALGKNRQLTYVNLSHNILLSSKE